MIRRMNFNFVYNGMKKSINYREEIQQKPLYYIRPPDSFNIVHHHIINTNTTKEVQSG